MDLRDPSRKFDPLYVDRKIDKEPEQNTYPLFIGLKASNYLDLTTVGSNHGSAPGHAYSSLSCCWPYH